MVAPVGGSYGVQPKSSLTAVAVYVNHRAALEYDFRSRFGFGVSSIDDESLGWQEITALIDGLIDDHTSHTFAACAGWSYVPSPAEVQFYNELDVKLAMNRGKNQPKPPAVKRPWEAPRNTDVVPSRQSVERRELLKARLGLGGVVDAHDQPDRQPQAQGDDRHQQVEPM